MVRLKPKNGEHEDIVVPADGLWVRGRVVCVRDPSARQVRAPAPDMV